MEYTQKPVVQEQQLKMLKLSDIYNYYQARFIFSKLNNVPEEPLFITVDHKP